MFYTNIINLGNHILVRGVDNGKRVKNRIPYKPKLYIRAKTPTSKFRSLQNEPLEELEFPSVYDAREFCKTYREVQNFKIYGQTRYEYAYISELFGKKMEYDLNKVVRGCLDIEVGSENGFPEPSSAFEPITAITLHIKNPFIKEAANGIYYVFGCGDFTTDRPDVRYIKCEDEKDLIIKFIRMWDAHCPDLITGWNIEFFDIPYIINRAKRLFLEEEILSLSPWKKISDREKTLGNKKIQFFNIYGVAIMDLIEIYKKYSTSGNQESYSLNHIASVEIGEKKLDYSEFENLYTLYKRDFQKFIEYNINDVTLVLKINDKTQLLELAMAMAYDNKVNFSDVCSQVTMWDAIINNALRLRGIIIPPKKDTPKGGQFVGAYVKEPVPGAYNYVVSLDLDGLYPHLIMMYNIGPETLLDPDGLSLEFSSWFARQRINVDTLLNKEIDPEPLHKENVALTPNGQVFSRQKQGFLAELMETMYEDRKKYKQLMLKAKKDLEIEKDSTKIEEIKARISKYSNLQSAKKITLNSAYGALGNEYFRFFDLRIAEAVTSSGQLAIRWIQKEMNEYLNKACKTSENFDFVIASDTDSIYLNLGPLIDITIPNHQEMSKIDVIRKMDELCENYIQKFIQKSYKKLDYRVNSFASKLIMKREALSDRALWTSKKHYMMQVYNNEGVEYTTPQLKIVGLEAVKSGSLPAHIRAKLKEGYRIILNQSRTSLIEFVEEYRKEFKAMPVEEIAMPRGCNNLAQYSDAKNIWGFKTPFHVKGALMYNHLIKQNKLDRKYPEVKEGEKIKYTYMKEPNPIQCNAISFPNSLPKEFGLHDYIDYDTQFEKSFLDPLTTVLNSVGWKLEETSSLDSFFS